MVVAVGPAAGLGISQTKAAIHHDPVRVVAVSVQRAGIDESGMAHGFREAPVVGYREMEANAIAEFWCRRQPFQSGLTVLANAQRLQ